MRKFPINKLTVIQREQLLRLAQEGGLRRKGADDAPRIAPVERSQPLALSFAQQRLWFLGRFEDASAAYHIPCGLRLTGRLDRDVLIRALDRIVARHEALRTSFALIDGQPVQRIADETVGFALTERDLSGGDAEAGDAEAGLDRLMAVEAAAPFDLERGPLIRGQLLRLAEDEHVLLATMHHIVSDGWSASVLINELSVLYAAFSRGEPDPLPPPPVQYADYAAWQRSWLEAGVAQQQTGYWKEALAGAPALLELPADRPRPAEQTYAGALRKVVAGAELTGALKALSRRHGVTLYMTLLAGWAALLARLSGQDDVVIGSPTANRGRPEIEKLIGFFVNTLAMRVDVSGAPSTAELLARVKTQSLAAQSNQDLPFEQVVEIVQPPRSLSYPPLFQVMFAWQNGPQAAFDLPGLTLSRLESRHATARVDLSLSLEEAGDEIVGWLEYATALFDGDTIERYVGYWLRLLEGMAADDGQAVDRLPLLGDAERHHVLVAWNTTNAEYPRDASVHELFELRAAGTPDAIALEHGERRFAYGELNAWANRLAHRLRGQGVAPGDRVALLLERSAELVAAELAVLKCGAAYVPIDPAFPGQRQDFMIRDCGAKVVITAEDMTLTEGEGGNPGVWADSASAAYVMYTSGSTGQAKGVVVPHRGIMRLVLNNGYARFDASDRVAFAANPAFDASTMEVWAPLLNGGRVVVIDQPTLLEPALFAETLIRHGVTVLWLTSGLLNQYADALAGVFPRLRYLLAGGDALDPRTVRKVLSDSPPQHFLNGYGPTETTTFATTHEITEVPEGARSIPIGRPIANTRVYILDAHGEPAPIGVTGELYIAGEGVALGYLNQQKLTAERFISDPFASEPEARMYRTGDLGRWRPDGTIEFLGRNDFQVKIRGFRIELGEIEARLAEHPLARNVAVLAREAVPGDRRLVAYYVADEDIGADALRAWLAAALPDYMIPAAYVRLDSLPLTANGKLDRNALPEPEGDAFAAQGYEAPVGEIEETLARIWAGLLGLERVGRRDNFFELGGHSLLAVTLIERLRQEGLRTDVHALFSAPTLAGLAASLSKDEGTKLNDAPLIRLEQPEIDRIAAAVPGGVANLQDFYPLAPLQEGILFHHLMETEGDAYLLPVLLAFDSRERLDGFLSAVQAVIDRHDILRTAMAWEGLSQPVQVVWRCALLSVEEIWLDGKEGDAADRLRALFDPRRFRIDVREAPLMRAFFARDEANGRWLLLLLNHHLAMDHTTLEILIGEVQAHLLGEADRLPPPLPFRNFVAQARLGVSEAEHEAFFRRMLADVDEPTAPFGLSDVQGDGSEIGEARVELEPALCRRLRERARALGVSAASLFHLAWAQVLARASGRDDVVFGTVLFGRMQGGEGADRALGMFINTLPIRIAVGDEGVEAAVRRTHGLLAELLQHEHASLALAQRCGGVPAPAPLFSALLNYRHSAMAEPATRMHGWEGFEILGGEERTNYPLVLSVDDLGHNSGHGFALKTQARRPLEARRVSEFMRLALSNLIDALETAPATPMRGVNVLPEPERHHVLVAWNTTNAEYPRDASVHELFERWAARTPDAIALEHGERRFAYGELNAWANRLAHRLRGQGVAPGDRVALVLERSAELVAAELAVLKCGAAYVPIDPAFPGQRQDFMIRDCGAKVVITAEDMTLTEGEGGNPGVWADSASAAYVMYTSGSTGQAKGVVVPHRGITRLVLNNGYARFDASDRVAFAANPAFDAATMEVWAPLLNGGRVVVIDQATLLEPARFAETLIRHGVTVLWLTSGLLNQYADALAGVFPRLRYLLAGGDALDPRTVRKVLRDSPPRHFLNGYGPTETTTFATTYEITDVPEGARSIPIGRPIANTRVYILDAHGEPAPIGVAGELHIGGEGVALGYLNQPELTAGRFLSDPFAEEPGARIYRTGDLGRWLPDGTIEFLGRNDFQVKIRGFRIELGEIEARLAEHPLARDVAVLAREAVPGDRRLFAYYVADEDIGADALRAWLATALPDYMIPAAYVRLDSLPLTANGKLDRNALPEPEGDAFAARAYEAPVGEIEETLARIWAGLLGLERVGRRDNFFELGGHSLLAVQVLSRLRQGLDKEASLAELFARPALSDFASSLANAGASVLPRIPPISRDGALALSFAQQRLWFLSQLQGASAAYHIPCGVRLTGRLDRYALVRALDRIVARHEALRTSFAVVDGQPAQQIADADCGFALAEHDLRGRKDAEAELTRRAAAEAAAAFDLERGPLIRGQLLRLGDDEHVLLATMHHIVSDGWSAAILIEDLKTLYAAFARGADDPLPPLPVQYADYAVWQRHWLESGVARRQAAYWKAELSGAPALLELPTDYPRPARQDYAGSAVKVALDTELTRALKALSQRHGVTLYMTLLAAWAALLTRLSGQDEVVIGSPAANRGNAEIEGLIGFFINTLAMRVDVSGAPATAELLARVKTLSLAAQSHQDIPFEQVVEIAQPPRSLAHAPLFQVMFAWQNAPRGTMELPGLELSFVENSHGAAQFDLSLSLGETGDEIIGSLEYATSLFKPRTIERYLAYWRRLLAAMAADDARPVASLPILGEAERRQMLAQWNATEADYPRDACIHSLFEAQTAMSPDAIAVAFADKTLTYKELNARANRLAHYLRGLGVGPDRRVGLCTRRGLDMAVALLAILKAGGAYVPLDPAYPVRRLRAMLEDSAPVALLTDAQSMMTLAELRPAPPVVDLAADAGQWADLPDADPDHERMGLAPHNLAYLIYTSGSTGTAKGVAIEHGNAVNFICWARSAFAKGTMERTLFSTSLNFDLSIYEFFVPLASGAAVRIAQNALDLIETPMDVTLINTVPSAMGALLDAGCVPPTVGTVNLAGEALKQSLVERLFATTGVNTVCNLYGPSETTTYSTWIIMRRGEPFAPHVGHPIANTLIYILDAYGEPVPVGVVGELYIGGAGVARGYLNRPDLTAGRFLPDPFAKKAGARMFRTGDLGRWLPGGAVEFLGRNDFQVKIRGFRIEPGEIEARLAEHPLIREATVLAREDSPGDKRLVAYYVGGEIGADALRAHIADALPDHMVPAAFVRLDALPLTPNGKLDRKALPAPEGDAFTTRGYEAPTGETEETLARIWAELLGLERVGRHDDFFALGGHSLLAVQLISILKQQGLNLSAAQLFTHPTVATLARHVFTGKDAFGGEDAPPDRSVTLLREGGDGRPLFLIPEVSGEMLYGAPLTRHLAAGFPVYGLTCRQAGAARRRTVQGIAERLTQAIRAVQPAGPYRLAGWSFGGKLAYEIATRLLGEDETIAFLGLIDTYYRAPLLELPASEEALLRELVTRSNRSPAAAEALNALDPGAGFTAAVRAYKELALLPASLSEEELRDLLAGYRMRCQADLEYQAQPIPAPIHLFTACDNAPGDASRGWGTVASEGQIHVVPVPGDHLSMMDDPNIAALGAALSRAIEAAGEVQPAAPASGYCPLVTIQAGQRETAPVFCIPGAGGNAVCFADFACALGDGWPVYALQPRGLDGLLVPHSRVEAAARAYAAAIRKCHPDRPVHLLGHSFGGWAAFETALQLQASSHGVASLTLVDSEAPGGDGALGREYTRAEALMEMVAICEQSAERSIGIALSDFEPLDASQQLALLHERLVQAGLMPPRSRTAALLGPAHAFETALRTVYRPEAVYPGPVRLALMDDLRRDDRERERQFVGNIGGWRRWAPDLVPWRGLGNHMTALKPPHVTALADWFKRRQERPKNK